MDLLGGNMSNGDLIQSLATLHWINTGEAEMMKNITVGKIGLEMYNRLSSARDVDALRDQTIAAIAKYVKDNPKAKREDLQKVISKHIISFARQVEQL